MVWRRRSRASRPVFARMCAAVCPCMDRGGLAEHRGRLLKGLSGRVIEVGAGSGMNFLRYPAAVNLVAVEPEPYLCRYMQGQAAAAPATIHVVEAVAERLPFQAGQFDAAVVTLTLCTVPDPPGMLAELYRVLRPGAQLRFLEHVRGQTPALRRMQRLLDATVWPRMFGNCHTGRDTRSSIVDAGFTVDWIESLRFPEMRVALPSSPHIIGVATRPAAAADIAGGAAGAANVHTTTPGAAGTRS